MRFSILLWMSLIAIESQAGFMQTDISSECDSTTRDFWAFCSSLPQTMGKRICDFFKKGKHEEARDLFYNRTYKQNVYLGSAAGSARDSNRKAIQAFLEHAFKRRPIASAYPEDDFFADSRKGYATLVFYPQDNTGRFGRYGGDFLIGDTRGHCALVTEYWWLNSKKEKIIDRQLISVEIPGNEDPSCKSLSGDGEHMVRVKPDPEVINELVWHYKAYKTPNGFYTALNHRYDKDVYYPYMTFQVDVQKMRDQLKKAEKDSNDGKMVGYNAISNNCCTYVMNLLKGMEVDIDWKSGMTGSWSHKPDNLKKAAVRSSSPKKAYNAPTEVENDPYMVYVEKIFFQRLFNDYCRSCSHKQ